MDTPPASPHQDAFTTPDAHGAASTPPAPGGGNAPLPFEEPWDYESPDRNTNVVSAGTPENDDEKPQRLIFTGTHLGKAFDEADPPN